MSAGIKATALRKHDPRQWVRRLYFGHAKMTLDHEPVDRGRIRIERPLGRKAGGRRPGQAGAGLAPAEFGNSVAVFLRQAGAGLALAPVCIRANIG